MAVDQRVYTVTALMLATFLTAVDVTIVDTAMPRIVGSLGGFSLLTWLITAYMLTSTATVPVYGKLNDLLGRKPTFTLGAIIFLAGSALCGAAQSMEQLILFRGLQGLGAGAILPTVQTIIADIFTPAERAKYQGWFSGVWGVSAMVGPLLGGFIVDHFTWRWLFYINLPLGAIALFMVWRYLEERVERRKVQIDYLGAVTLTAGITCLMLVLLTGGAHYPWVSAPVLSMAVAAAGLLAFFCWHERRVADPILPLSMFRSPAIGLPVLASFMIGGVLYGMTIYLPVWAQGVQGFSATRSGASLLWLSIGWSVAAVVSGRLVLRLGVRPAARLGLVLKVVSALGLVVFGRTLGYLPEVVLAALTLTLGWGMGFSTLAFILGIQNSVGWAQRGVATASLQFVRTLGGMVWVSAMGAVMNLTLLRRLAAVPGVSAGSAKEAGDVANALLDPTQWGTLPEAQLGALRDALAWSLRNVHVMVALAALISLAVVWTLPNMRLGADPKSAQAKPRPV